MGVCIYIYIYIYIYTYCKTHYYRAPFNFARGEDDAYITGADIRSNSITMPHLVVIQLMRVIILPRSDSDGSYVKINVRGNKGFYSIYIYIIIYIYIYIHIYIYTHI